MKYIKMYEEDPDFIEGDIVKFKSKNDNEPFEIVKFGVPGYYKLKSLIRNYSMSWILAKNIKHLTEKEREDLEIKLNANKYNI